MLFPQDSCDLFTVEILIYVEMMDCIFEASPVVSVHGRKQQLMVAWRSGAVWASPDVTCVDLRKSKISPRKSRDRGIDDTYDVLNCEDGQELFALLSFVDVGCDCIGEWECFVHVIGVIRSTNSHDPRHRPSNRVDQSMESQVVDSPHYSHRLSVNGRTYSPRSESRSQEYDCGGISRRKY
jgi:hypothetical protein